MQRTLMDFFRPCHSTSGFHVVGLDAQLTFFIWSNLFVLMAHICVCDTAEVWKLPCMHRFNWNVSLVCIKITTISMDDLAVLVLIHLHPGLFVVEVERQSRWWGWQWEKEGDIFILLGCMVWNTEWWRQAICPKSEMLKIINQFWQQYE